MHLKRSLLSCTLNSTDMEELTRSILNVFVFQLLYNCGNIIKYLNKWCPSFDFILNWLLKVIIYCVLQSFIQNRVLFKFFPLSHLMLHTPACSLQYQLLQQWEQNTPKVKSALCKTIMTTLTFQVVYIYEIYSEGQIYSFLIIQWSPSIPYTNFYLDCTYLWPCLLCNHFLSISKRPFYDTEKPTIILTTELYLLLPLLFSCATS